MPATEITSLICGDQALISITELFQFLQIKNSLSDDNSQIKGFFITTENNFTIDTNQKLIKFNGKSYVLEEGALISTKTNLFLKLNYLGDIFGLNATFNFRKLSISIETDLELPSVKAARLKMRRENLNKITHEFDVDTSIKRDKKPFHFGVVDWNLLSHQDLNGYRYNWFNAGFGAMLAGGELTGRFNYNSKKKITLRNQFLTWRYVSDNNSLFQQIQLGKIVPNSTASLFNPVVGFQISNIPATRKKSLGTYTISDYTQPNWIVELYINNTMVDYTRADESGFFSFKVPVFYGSTEITLKYFGPFGEEDTASKILTIPYNFMPAGDFQYSLSSGMIEDGQKNIIANLRTQYGLSRDITIGSGIEYLSSLKEDPFIPFVNASVRLPNNIILSTEYMHKVGFFGNLNYRSASDFRIDLKYKKYRPGQQAIPFGYLEERVAEIFMPVKGALFSGISRLSFRQNFLRENNFINALWQLTGRSLGMNYSLSTEAFISSFGNSQFYSKLQTFIHFPANFLFSPQIQVDLRDGEVNFLRGELRKKLFNEAFIIASYNQNFKYNQFSLNLGFSLNTNFSRIGINSSFENRNISFSESISGSAQIDVMNDYYKISSRSSLGQGSVKFSAFLDINNNSMKDPLEPILDGLEIISLDGTPKDKKNKEIIYSHLEPYKTYNFKVETAQLENIAWISEIHSLEIVLNPNQVKNVQIPIKVVGEISGYVMDNTAKGIGGIKIAIYNRKGEIIKTLLSAPDGYFNFLGLPSGHYSVQPLPSQLKKIGFYCNDKIPFLIENSVEGDIIDTLNFRLVEIEGG
ncbi:carboxypeptidase-like regulatory domain-containing protein [Christiangramia fulva]|nr:carboxypeptidase-like regulatory domain-containing protein [Christiangramia fulva]